MDQLLKEHIAQRLNDRKNSDKRLMYSIAVYILMSAFTLGYFSLVLLEERSLIHYTISKLPLALSLGTFLLSITLCIVISENYLARINDIDTLQNVMVISAVLLVGVLVATYNAIIDLLNNHSFDAVAGYALLSLSFIAFQVFVGVLIFGYAAYESYQYRIHSRNLSALFLKTAYTIFMLVIWYFEVLFFDFIF